MRRGLAPALAEHRGLHRPAMQPERGGQLAVANAGVERRTDGVGALNRRPLVGGVGALEFPVSPRRGIESRTLLFAEFAPGMTSPTYSAALRRAQASTYPLVRRGRRSLPRFDAAPPIALPSARRRSC
jgi:hypothetical protein